MMLLKWLFIGFHLEISKAAYALRLCKNGWEYLIVSGNENEFLIQNV